ELVDEPAVAVHLLDNDREESVQEFHDFGGRLAGHQLGGADQVDEDDGHVAFFPAQFRSLAFRGEGDLPAYMPAEKIAHAFAFPQTVDHGVETTLQLAEFGAVEYHQVAPQVA